jgi:hypothetical protein
VDVVQLGEILNNAARWDSCQIFSDKLKNMFNDPVIPANGAKAQSQGRDTQFELWTLLSIPEAFKPRLTQAGNTKTPDICFEIKDRKIAIETKRLKSERQIIRRASQGNKQLRKASTIGAVAIDFSETLRDLEATEEDGDPIATIIERLQKRLELVAPSMSDSKTTLWLFAHALVFVRTASGLVGPVGAWVRFETR